MKITSESPWDHTVSLEVLLLCYPGKHEDIVKVKPTSLDGGLGEEREGEDGERR